MGTEFDAELGIDAPIDGLLAESKAPKNLEGAKALLECFSTGAAAERYLAADPSNVGAAKDVDTSGYTDFQKAAAAVIGSSGAIAQFLDRDTIPAFAGATGMQPQLQSFIGNPDQDLDAYLQRHPGPLGRASPRSSSRLATHGPPASDVRLGT